MEENPPQGIRAYGLIKIRSIREVRSNSNDAPIDALSLGNEGSFIYTNINLLARKKCHP